MLKNSIAPKTGNSFFTRHLIAFENNHFRIIANPVISSEYKITNENGKTLSDTELGLHTILTAGTKLSLQALYTINYTRFPEYISNKIDTLKYIPHHGSFSSRDHRYKWNNAKANILFQPFEFLDLQAGFGINRFGNGYRSLFLSGNAHSYPYFRADVHVWKIHYSYLTGLFNDVHKYNPPFERKNKYAAFHYLRWDINSRFQVNLFETVIWAPDDSTIRRGFDINYLNPVVFFRPVEFSTGSPDNVLLGTGMRLRLFDETFIYGQFALDEFNLQLVRQRNGWWGVKYGYQLGLMIPNLFRIPGLFTRFEVNSARPFTYSHSFTAKSYGHFVQPLAHPLGSNFLEFLNQSSFKKNRWKFHNRFFLQRFGEQQHNQNFGNDIYISNNNRAKDYNNTLFQPRVASLVLNDFTVSYIIQPLWQLELTGGIFSKFQLSSGKSPFIYFHVGFRTSLTRRDFWDGRYQ